MKPVALPARLKSLGQKTLNALGKTYGLAAKIKAASSPAARKNVVDNFAKLATARLAVAGTPSIRRPAKAKQPSAQPVEKQPATHADVNENYRAQIAEVESQITAAAKTRRVPVELIARKQNLERAWTKANRAIIAT